VYEFLMPSGMKINLCSGQRPFQKPWINIDVNPRWEPDIVADGASLPMIEDGSAEYIVIEHGIEHFGCGEADSMLRECHRILQVGGSLIITAPNMRTLAQRWLTRQIDDYIFAVNTYGAYMNNEADRHKWLVTFESLTKTLESVGTWTCIKQFDFRKLGDVSLSQDWWIAGYEAVK